MGDYLNPENGFFSLLSKIFDLIVLNLIYVLMNAPLAVTVYINLALLFKEQPSWHPLYVLLALVCGCLLVPTSTALYYSVVKSVRHRRSYPVKEYFRSFKQNFLQGMGASYIFLVIGGLLVFDFWYALQVYSENGTATYLLIFVVISFFVVSTFLYYCPVLSRFQMKQWNALKFSLGLAARHMGYTVLIVLMWIAFGVLGYFTKGLTLFILLAVGVYVESLMMEKILKKYVLKTMEQQAEKEAAETDGDDTVTSESDDTAIDFKRLDQAEAAAAEAEGRDGQKKKKNPVASDDEWYLE